MGTTKTFSGGEIKTVKSQLIHPEYDGYDKIHDIAILELSEDIEFTDSIQPIKIPSLPSSPSSKILSDSKKKMFAAGWGLAYDREDKNNAWLDPSQLDEDFILHSYDEQWRSLYNSVRKIMQRVLQMIEVMPKNCGDVESKYYGTRLPSDSIQICTSGLSPTTQGVCDGDSGGPIISYDMASGQYEIIGIISQAGSLGSRYAVPCTSTFQQESTRVWEFVKWIQENVNDLP